ncbi:30054_t:CDS:2, partial [Racocetra persica]
MSTRVNCVIIIKVCLYSCCFNRKYLYHCKFVDVDSKVVDSVNAVDNVVETNDCDPLDANADTNSKLVGDIVVVGDIISDTVVNIVADVVVGTVASAVVAIATGGVANIGADVVTNGVVDIVIDVVAITVVATVVVIRIDIADVDIDTSIIELEFSLYHL